MRVSFSRPSLFLAAAALVCGACASALQADAPRVIAASPANGQRGVDPRVTELRIEFDQPMGQGGYSLVGGGPSFPKLLGEPRWLNDRTFVAAVQLQSGHAYQLSINSARFTGFRNQQGQPAEPYAVAFHTSGRPGDPIAVTREDNRKALEALRQAIDDRYSYRDRLKLDWDALFQAHSDAMLSAATAEQFAAAAGAMLASAQDPHLWTSVQGRLAETTKRRFTLSVDGRRLPVRVPQHRRINDVVATGRFPDDIGYIEVRSWRAGHAALIDAVFESIRSFQDCKALIIDVRLNGGGDERLARTVAGCFVDKPVVYAMHEMCDPAEPTGFTAPAKRVLQPTDGRPTFHGNVAVLSGPAVMSSGEAFLLMMKQAPGCVLVGQPSAGASGNPRPHDLGTGVAVYLPSWRAMTADGEVFEGVGVAPDIRVDAAAEQFAERDPVLDAALGHLRR